MPRPAMQIVHPSKLKKPGSLRNGTHRAGPWRAVIAHLTFPMYTPSPGPLCLSMVAQKWPRPSLHHLSVLCSPAALLLQGCGHQAPGHRHLSAAVRAGPVLLPVLRGRLPQALHPQGAAPATRAERLAEAAAALRAPPGRPQDLIGLALTWPQRAKRSAPAPQHGHAPLTIARCHDLTWPDSCWVHTWEAYHAKRSPP